jgi:hypothetical protein
MELSLHRCWSIERTRYACGVHYESHARCTRVELLTLLLQDSGAGRSARRQAQSEQALMEFMAGSLDIRVGETLYHITDHDPERGHLEQVHEALAQLEA